MGEACPLLFVAVHGARNKMLRPGLVIKIIPFELEFEI